MLYDSLPCASPLAAKKQLPWPTSRCWHKAQGGDTHFKWGHRYIGYIGRKVSITLEQLPATLPSPSPSHSPSLPMSQSLLFVASLFFARSTHTENTHLSGCRVACLRCEWVGWGLGVVFERGRQACNTRRGRLHCYLASFCCTFVFVFPLL